MSTKGCIIKLKKEKCEIDYIHHGLDFINELFYKSSGDFISRETQEMIKIAVEECVWHIDITDKQMIERLFKYDTDIIKMDAEMFLFYEDKGLYYDFTLRWSNPKPD